MLGKLSWSAIPFDQPIPLVASLVVMVVFAAALAWVGRKRQFAGVHRTSVGRTRSRQKNSASLNLSL